MSTSKRSTFCLFILVEAAVCVVQVDCRFSLPVVEKPPPTTMLPPTSATISVAFSTSAQDSRISRCCQSGVNQPIHPNDSKQQSRYQQMNELLFLKIWHIFLRRMLDPYKWDIVRKGNDRAFC